MLVQPRIGSAARQQLGVRAILDDPAALHHNDPVRVADGAEPVRDHNAGARVQDAGQRLLNPAARYSRVDTADRLVEAPARPRG